MTASIRIHTIEIGNHASHDWRSITSPRAAQEVPAGTDVQLTMTPKDIPGGPDTVLAALAQLRGVVPEVIHIGYAGLLCINCPVVVGRQNWREWLEKGTEHPLARKIVDELLKLIAANAPKK